MKSITLIALCLGLSQAVSANSTIITHTSMAYPSAGIEYYAQAEDILIAEANMHCKSMSNQQIDKISNITIQVQGDFALNNSPHRPAKTKAITYPHIVITALVSCKNEIL